VLSVNHHLCLECLESLPQTDFHLFEDNPMEKHFWGRLPVVNGTSQFYYTKESMMQKLMHEFKYRGNKELGLYLGRLLGRSLQESRFNDIDALVPLPLFPAKEKKRGFNQSQVLCEGIAEIRSLPVLKDVIIRTADTESQTKKNRVERWQNMEGKFELIEPQAVKGRHILLIDDVITTGATLEACGRELIKAEGLRLSIATLCFSSH
ncbi:MAG TPA: phosphoribosyltransferase family protein, partial [Chitinophagaceae bacterium]